MLILIGWLWSLEGMLNIYFLKTYRQSTAAEIHSTTIYWAPTVCRSLFLAQQMDQRRKRQKSLPRGAHSMGGTKSILTARIRLQSGTLRGRPAPASAQPLGWDDHGLPWKTRTWSRDFRTSLKRQTLLPILATQILLPYLAPRKTVGTINYPHSLQPVTHPWHHAVNETWDQSFEILLKGKLWNPESAD